jgi:hypothetical protein
VGVYEILVGKYGFKRYIVNDRRVTFDRAARVELDMKAGGASDDPNAGKESLKPYRCLATAVTRPRIAVLTSAKLVRLIS